MSNSTALSTTVITEQHMTITESMIGRVKSFLESEPRLVTYTASSDYAEVEEAELRLGNDTVRIRYVRSRG